MGIDIITVAEIFESLMSMDGSVLKENKKSLQGIFFNEGKLRRFLLGSVYVKLACLADRSKPIT